MGKPRYTRKYPTYPKISESKKDTWKYSIVYFHTFTRPATWYFVHYPTRPYIEKPSPLGTAYSWWWDDDDDDKEEDKQDGIVPPPPPGGPLASAYSASHSGESHGGQVPDLSSTNRTNYSCFCLLLSVIVLAIVFVKASAARHLCCSLNRWFGETPYFSSSPPPHVVPKHPHQQDYSLWLPTSWGKNM